MKLVSIVCVFLATTSVFAQKAPAGRAEFEAMYKFAQKAFEAKNLKPLEATLTADFTETAMGRTMNRKDSIAGLKQFLGMFKTLRCMFTMTSWTSNGARATTTDKVHFWGTMIGPDKKTHKVDATRTETMTWVKSGKRWMIKHIEAKNEKMLMDGKPMPIGKPGTGKSK